MIDLDVVGLGNLTACVSRAHCLSKLSRFREARASIERAMDLKPGWFWARRLLANLPEEAWDKTAPSRRPELFLLFHLDLERHFDLLPVQIRRA